ncbi:MAG: hypothetical protein A2W03_01755 [Candidatus Aminicenantes bacterium RBG_16_63_16]|nr:MAG: hypothetical protein A2W03_01755 [Candidatus Aminicenantes bacterium RBG_16_63_16]
MAGGPGFPDFRALRLDDRDVISRHLRSYQPETSELTFTNLFIWRAHYGWLWSLDGSHFILLSSRPGAEPYFLPPVGPPSRAGLSLKLLRWLREERSVNRPRIERADGRLMAELASVASLRSEPTRDQYDYLYRTENLISLAGSRYHAKRNHISRFSQAADAKYASVGESNIAMCAEFQDRWCEKRRCAEDLSLLGEWESVKEALANYPGLGLTGGAFLIEGRVEAFTFGELLNAETAVVHVEKANPEIPGLYAAINQRFCREHWSRTPFVNREQDLGEPGLRKAKLSYHPFRLVEKYRIWLAE